MLMSWALTDHAQAARGMKCSYPAEREFQCRRAKCPGAPHAASIRVIRQGQLETAIKFKNAHESMGVSPCNSAHPHQTCVEVFIWGISSARQQSVAKMAHKDALELSPLISRTRQPAGAGDQAPAGEHDDSHLQTTTSSYSEAEPAGWRQYLLQHQLSLVVIGLVVLSAVILATVKPWTETGAPSSGKCGHGLSIPYPHKDQYAIDPEVEAGVGPVWWPPNPHASEEANRHFLLGLRLLHVFWYDEARKEFQHAIDCDPRYVMGYWGVAMTYKQALWMTEEPDTARHVLQEMERKADKSIATEQEQQYIKAAQALWAADQSMEARERAYSSTMKEVYQSRPDDVDACAFYGLSLLSMTANSGRYLTDKEEHQVITQARDVLNKCAARWWDHAGLLHYITHAYDEPDPAIASQGLAAGLHLSEVAWAACHAQHMKSHLFLELGNWTQVVDSNYRSVVASDRFCNRHYSQDRAQLMACDKDDRYHALEWWMYGLTQQCAMDDARALLGRMMEVYTYLDESPFDQWALRMWSHVVVQSQAAPDVPALLAPLLRGKNVPNLSATLKRLIQIVNVSNPLPTEDEMVWEVHARASALLAGAYALTLHSNTSRQQLGSDMEVQALHAGVQDAMAFLLRSVPASMAQMHEQVQVYSLQVQALQIVAACAMQGKLDSRCQGWTAKLDQAVAGENKIWGHGPTLQILPAWELYGHLLLVTQQQPAKAAEYFQYCLQKLPHRQSCLLGAARAALLAGDAKTANERYTELWQQCSPHSSPSDFLWPGLVETYFMTMPQGNTQGDTQGDTQGSTGSTQGSTQGGTGSTQGATPSASQRQYFYSYGDVWVYPTAMNSSYVPPADKANDLALQYPSPYPIPADFDAVNRQRLQQAKPPYLYASEPVSFPVANYPGGQVVLNKSSNMYQWVVNTKEADGKVRAKSYWPPSDNLFTDAQRRVREGDKAGTPHTRWLNAGGVFMSKVGRKAAKLQKKVGRAWSSHVRRVRGRDIGLESQQDQPMQAGLDVALGGDAMQHLDHAKAALATPVGVVHSQAPQDSMVEHARGQAAPQQGSSVPVQGHSSTAPVSGAESKIPVSAAESKVTESGASKDPGQAVTQHGHDRAKDHGQQVWDGSGASKGRAFSLEKDELRKSEKKRVLKRDDKRRLS